MFDSDTYTDHEAIPLASLHKRRRPAAAPAHATFEFQDCIPITRAGRIAILLAVAALILQCSISLFR